MTEPLETISLEVAARSLCLAPSTLRRRAAAGIVPAYKPGRRWVFKASEINAYLESKRRPQSRPIDAAFSSMVEKPASQLARRIAKERAELIRTSAARARHQ